MNMAEFELKRVPLHKQISDQLRREILADCQVGERFGSQNELSRRFGVSTLTVREAVNALVQEGLLERRRGSGTYVLDTSAGKAIAILVELDITEGTASHFYLGIVRSLEEYFSQRGHVARTYIGHAEAMQPEHVELPTSKAFWDDYERDQIAGVVHVGYYPTPRFTSLMDAKNIPQATRLESVYLIDYKLIAKAAAEAIVAAGARRIALIQHASHEQSIATVLARHGLELNADWVGQVSGGGQFETATAAFRHIWQAGPVRPDGLIVMDDVLYRGLAPMLLANGIRVPQDLAVVSHANRGDPQPLIPEPIRIEIDPEECGVVLGRNMIRRLSEPQADLIDMPVPVDIVQPAVLPDELLL